MVGLQAETSSLGSHHTMAELGLEPEPSHNVAQEEVS